MDHAKFFSAIRSDPRLGSPRLTQAQVDVAQAIVARGNGLRRTALAYVLATAWHEAKMTPVRENMIYSSTAQLRKVWPSRFPTTASALPFVRQPVKLANHVYGDRLGNRAGTDDGFIYRGGGVDQLTGRGHYTNQGIAHDPDAILQPSVAVASLVAGMTLGRYRGHKLADFFTATATNYLAARAILNADVERVGHTVARYAEAFDAALQAGRYAEGVSVAPPLPAPVPGRDPAPTVPVHDAAPAPDRPAAPAPGAVSGLWPILAVAAVALGLFFGVK